MAKNKQTYRNELTSEQRSALLKAEIDFDASLISCEGTLGEDYTPGTNTNYSTSVEPEFSEGWITRAWERSK